ncbi:MAG: ribosome recycling factor [bacterium]|nr:ribosome recycling factor [bacterium]
MTYKDFTNTMRPELEKAIVFFSKELSKIRTGFASPSLVEDVVVEVFGQKMPLKQVASITVPEPRQILIQPWDSSSIEPIQRALSAGLPNISPVAEKDFIRINLPPLTQELRQMLVKLLGEKGEEARRVVRKLREDAWEKIQEGVKKGELREDDKFRGKEELQKLVDEYNKKIEDLKTRKEKEIQS